MTRKHEAPLKQYSFRAGAQRKRRRTSKMREDSMNPSKNSNATSSGNKGAAVSREAVVLHAGENGHWRGDSVFETTKNTDTLNRRKGDRTVSRRYLVHWIGTSTLYGKWTL